MGSVKEVYEIMQQAGQACMMTSTSELASFICPGWPWVTLLTEIYYLNVMLAMFNTMMVMPMYYVCFTFCMLLTSVILYQGLKASTTKIITIVFGLFIIYTGIFILQMSKVNPCQLMSLDRYMTPPRKVTCAEADTKSAREIEWESTITSCSSRHWPFPTLSTTPSSKPPPMMTDEPDKPAASGVEHIPIHVLIHGDPGLYGIYCTISTPT